MKKFFAILLACALAFVPCTAAFAAQQSDIDALRGTKLYVYNWGEYISDGADGTLDINAEFEKKYGIEVVYDTYDNNEVMYSKLKGGGIAEQLRRIAALCRRQAAATGKICAAEFDPARRRLFFGKEQVTYPQELRILRNGEELQEPGIVLRFFPDGGAAETALAFERDGETATLRISPLTGSIVIDETE